jgi:sulfate adenylyltransferase
VFGTLDDSHPGVNYLLHQSNPVYLGGRLEGLTTPPHHTYRELRHSPSELRSIFIKKGWQKVVAFQTRNPMHRAHVELTRRAMKKVGANLLIHPVVGMTKPGDVDYFSRVRCYKAVISGYPERQSVMLSLLPLAMRMGGPREAVWHAIIRKNYGCTHFIVGRDHAGPGKARNGEPFYDPYAAQELVRSYEDELGIKMVDFEEMVYVEDLGQYMPRSEVPEGMRILDISGTELRRRLREGIDIPEWFSYPEVIAELRRSHPPRREQGFTVWITGLVGSGKSTVANVLTSKLLEYGGKPVSLIDSEVIEKYLAEGLVTSKEGCDTIVRRVGYLASEITKNRGIAICAPVAPYRASRGEARRLVSEYGGFVEVHLATPLEVCRERDRKGIYRAAEEGALAKFPGVTDPYEEPLNPELTLDTSNTTPEEAAQAILLYLEREGYIGG